MTLEATLQETNALLRQLLNAAGQGAGLPAAAAASTQQSTSPVAPSRGRGRPVKGETAPTAPPTAPAPEAAKPEVQDPLDFLNTTSPPEPEKPKATIEMVREALVKYQVRSNSPEKARAILKTVGGVDTLQSLPEAKWQAVIDTANKA